MPKPNKNDQSQEATVELIALKRAAQNALELARRTGTPCHVIKDGRIVDIAASPSATKRKARKTR